MAERTLAETFLLAAERDQQAFRKLADDPTLHDSLAGSTPNKPSRRH